MLYVLDGNNSSDKYLRYLEQSNNLVKILKQYLKPHKD